MASETNAEFSSGFSIVEKLGVEKLRLLLDVAAELSSYTAGEIVSVGDLAFDERVTEQEIGRSRVRDALALFQTLGLLELDENVKTLQLSPGLIDWSHRELDERSQQLNGLLQSHLTASEAPAKQSNPEPEIGQEPTVESPPEPSAPPRRNGPSRFGRGAGRQPVRVTTNAKSDEELMADLEPNVSSAPSMHATPSALDEAIQADLNTGPSTPLSLAVRRPAPARPEAGAAERRRWGGNGLRGTGVTPNAAAVRRPILPAENRSETPSVARQPSLTPDRPPAGILNLPTFFRLLDELNERAEKLRQAGLTDDPNIKIDLLQLIDKIQKSQE